MAISAKELIDEGKAVLGMELGSTRIKAVLIGEDHAPIAMGSHSWENQLVDGVWTYSLTDVWAGIQDAYADLAADVKKQYGTEICSLAGIGVSAMMHGYLPFDKDGNQICGFRTWRNTMTGEAAAALTEKFGFNIPQRWSIAHLYQAILNGEEHVKDIDFLATLAVYVHWKLTGKKAAGVGEASGMFPIDSTVKDYDAGMMEKFGTMIADKGYPWTLRGILPKVMDAGEDAGCLTADGAKLLDPTGKLQPGAPMCPPEGDAGTGMAATNSVRPGTGNISAGTSVFAMIVLEKALSKVHMELDMVTTPDGLPVAMVHCNNCTSDINAWAGMLGGFMKTAGLTPDMNKVYEAIFSAALEGDPDCGGLINVNYLSGEPVTGLTEGRPMMVRMPDTSLSFANLARSLVFGAVATLKLGMDILTQEENVTVKSLLGAGGLYKTGVSGQKLTAAALNTPVSVMKTAGEGGPWGMALLAAYAVRKQPGETLPDYLEKRVFAGSEGSCMQPDPKDVAGFAAYIARYRQALEAEKAACAAMC